ncbi:MAG: hypothetical protein IJ870_04960 [Alphaproteobacteria bacterium]|nr:hypothetical protein [Alphaproteobacteria bacterium]
MADIKRKSIIAVAIAMVMANMNINAQEAPTFRPEMMTTEGIEQIDSMVVAEEATRSRFIAFQKSTGEFARVWIDNPEVWHPKVMVGGGYAINKDFQTPTISAGFQWDGMGLWKKSYMTQDGRYLREPVRILGAGIEGNLGWATYLPGSVSEGKKYLRYEVFAHIDVRLLEDKAWRHRVNLFVGGGYTFAKHDHLDYEGDYARVDVDGEGMPTGLHVENNQLTMLTGNHITPHQGSGVFGGVGLSYEVRPWRSAATRLRLHGGYYFLPKVEYDKTTVMGEARIGLSVELGTWHNHQAPKRHRR